MIIEILRITTLAIVLILFSAYTAPIGGILYTSVSLSFRIPYIGKLFKALLYDYVKIVTIVKLISWLISASGVLLGYLVFSWLWGENLNAIDSWVVFSISFSVVINICYDLCQFNIRPFSYHFGNTRQYGDKYFKEELDIIQTDTILQKSLSRSLFIDLYLPQLFRLLFSIGLLYFALVKLKILEINTPTLPTLSDCIKASFSTIPVVPNYKPIFKGDLWQMCNIICAFLIFLWTVFFLSAAQSLFNDREDVKDNYSIANQVSEDFKEIIKTTMEKVTKEKKVKSESSTKRKKDH